MAKTSTITLEISGELSKDCIYYAVEICGYKTDKEGNLILRQKDCEQNGFIPRDDWDISSMYCLPDVLEYAGLGCSWLEANIIQRMASGGSFNGCEFSKKDIRALKRIANQMPS